VRSAIVIGIDDYHNDDLRLYASVSDAIRFRDWVTAPDGGGVAESNLWLLLSPHPSETAASGLSTPAATKDNIVTAINEMVIAAAKEETERLYFYFAGHGITARVSNRDESALVLPGFNELHTDHSLALRSIAEYFETTAFADQFFYIDACRNIPWPNREFEVGRWPVPRRQDPGAQPVQQFILYATASGHFAKEEGWPGEATGAFTGTLLDGLAGTDDAKAWSWERNCYEVRWERLAAFIHRRMTARLPANLAENAGQIQVPQDTGTRGVAGRDRDVPVVSFPSGHFPQVQLTVELAAQAKNRRSEVSVLDAIGEPVASALRVTGDSQTFLLSPKTYAVRATTTSPKPLFGSLKAPIELYEDRAVQIQLEPRVTSRRGKVITERLGPEDIATAGRKQPPGMISIQSLDPLAVAEIVDETGRVVAVAPPGESLTTKPGFYQIRHIGPEATQDPVQIVLAAGERESVILTPPPPDPEVAALVTALGGRIEDNYVRMAEGADPITWARPSTIVAAGVAMAMQGDTPAGLGVDDLRETLGKGSGMAVFVGGCHLDDHRMEQPRLTVGIWPAGEPVGTDGIELDPGTAGIAGLVRPISEPKPYWVSLSTPNTNTKPTVISVPVLPGRLATLVAHIDSDRIRLHQYHPAIQDGPSSTVDRLRRVEYLQRLLVAGRIDIAEGLARQLAEAANDDPFAGVVAGYILLRLGRHEELDKLASMIIDSSNLPDGYILRGEYEASKGRLEAADQAFANAINTGIPAFGEGLTRLLEGLRRSGLTHPRAAIVRYIFQRHARGSMWAAFNPRRGLQPGVPVINAVDLGLEA